MTRRKVGALARLCDRATMAPTTPTTIRCAACGALAVDLRACRACGSLRGYVAGRPATPPPGSAAAPLDPGARNAPALGPR